MMNFITIGALSILSAWLCVSAIKMSESMGLFATDEQTQYNLDPLYTDGDNAYYLAYDDEYNKYNYMRTGHSISSTINSDDNLVSINYQDGVYLSVKNFECEYVTTPGQYKPHGTVTISKYKHYEPYVTIHKYHYEGIMEILMRGFGNNTVEPYVFHIPSGSKYNIIHEE